MHTYKDLWQEINSDKLIDKCIKKAAIGKLDRESVQYWMKDVPQFKAYLRANIKNWKNYPHDPVVIHDNSSHKERIIIVPKYEETVVQYMIVETLKPLLTKGMYRHTYSSIPGRGLHGCMKAIRKWIDNDRANCKYCLKLDIRKFFNSIDHDLLKARFAKYINDKKMLKLIFEVIEASPDGLPLGFYTSHWFANWYLQPLDHYIKEELHVKHYARYMDDMALFGSNKRELHRVKVKIEQFLAGMGLKLKDNWQLFRFDYKNKKTGKSCGRPLDFVGFKIYRNKTLLRKSILLKLTRKAKKIQKKNKFTIFDAHQMMSYLGWVDWSDTYQVYKKYVAPTITFKKCRKRISQYDKLQRKLSKQLELQKPKRAISFI